MSPTHSFLYNQCLSIQAVFSVLKIKNRQEPNKITLAVPHPPYISYSTKSNSNSVYPLGNSSDTEITSRDHKPTSSDSPR